MAFDLVPWAIEGASTDAALARVLANIASKDSEGINLPGDFKVTALGTPGPQVNIAPGGMVVRNAQAPGESYVGIARSDTLQSISATTGASRSDLLIAQVIDPDFAPWQAYTDPNMILNGPYFQPVIISGVSPSVTKASEVVSYSAYAIARFDIPNNTTNITDSMIVDLRSLALPHTSSDYTLQYGVGDGSGGAEHLTTAETSWTHWPSNAWQTTVPPWATDAVISIQLNALPVDGDATFNSRVNFGGLTGGTAMFDYEAADGETSIAHITHTTFADLDVTTLQGQTISVYLEAERTNATTKTGNLGFGLWEQMIFDVRFRQQTR